MTHLTQSQLLDSLIAQAWQEIQHDPQHRLRIGLRFALYDALIGDLAVPLRALTAAPKISLFPQFTPGLKRFWYLGLHTVRPLLVLWDQAMTPWLAANPEYDPDWSFPQDILTVTNDLLHGIPYDHIEEAFVEQSVYGGDLNAWHGMVGELDEIGLPETAMHSLRAIYALYCSVCGVLPMGGQIADDAYDAPDVYPYDSNDWTAYAWAAVRSSRDSAPTGVTHRTKHGQTAALDFWYWWLFEQLPAAALINVTRLGWHITTTAWHE